MKNFRIFSGAQKYLFKSKSFCHYLLRTELIFVQTVKPLPLYRLSTIRFQICGGFGQFIGQLTDEMFTDYHTSLFCLSFQKI